ncbi:unnamed protein product [Fraxinus pennsylvanica]|uniref:Uncharacterized protein n=1 Tax=Fraxinus pennsylvanica TaxID=56036 RepID=A0AAD1ZGC2_9LAMI|nr:unnamed protein product [Fraxinus pennsylvanica]
MFCQQNFTHQTPHLVEFYTSNASFGCRLGIVIVPLLHKKKIRRKGKAHSNPARCNSSCSRRTPVFPLGLLQSPPFEEPLEFEKPFCKKPSSLRFRCLRFNLVRFSRVRSCRQSAARPPPDQSVQSQRKMEESEKRRERLKAMRMEANRGGNDGIPESSGMVSHDLSNPLIEGETESPANYASSRFDYYTNPMAAFSSNKKGSQVSHQVPQQYYNTPPRPGHPDMSHSPAYQDQSINSPGQKIFQAPAAYYNYGPVGSISSSPSGRNPQSTWGAPIGDFNYSNSSNLPRGSNFTRPGFGQGGTPKFGYGRGRGQRYNSSPLYGSGCGVSPYPDSGRSRGRSAGNNSMSPGSGQRGRRGVSSHSPVSAELRPDMYYNHEMVEDPWKELNPVIWKGQYVNPNSEISPLPKSVSIKKPRVSSEVSNKSTSEPSLAEYLAASFSEAVNNEARDD